MGWGFIGDLYNSGKKKVTKAVSNPKGFISDNASTLLGAATFGSTGALFGSQADKNRAADKEYESQVGAYPQQYKAQVEAGIRSGEKKAESLYGKSDTAGEYQGLKSQYKASMEGRGPEFDRIKSLYGQEGARLQQSQQASGIKGSLAAKQQMEQSRAGSMAAEELAMKNKAMATDRYAKMLGGEISDRATIAMGYGQLYGAGMQPPMPAEKQGLLSGLLGGLV